MRPAVGSDPPPCGGTRVGVVQASSDSFLQRSSLQIRCPGYRVRLPALPTLGRDAARTVQTLAVRGELVTRQPIPLQPRTAWRAIRDGQATLLTERFATAALTSARALAAVRDLHPTPPPPQHSARSEPARQRHLSQTLDQRGASR